MDYDDEVLYVYEIQLEQEYRRKGLGRFMMQVRIVRKQSIEFFKAILVAFMNTSSKLILYIESWDTNDLLHFFQVLEMLSFKNDMRKIMLTVFKFNYDAQRFFKQIMKFETDETTPEEDDVDGVIN